MKAEDGRGGGYLGVCGGIKAQVFLLNGMGKISMHLYAVPLTLCKKSWFNHGSLMDGGVVCLCVCARCAGGDGSGKDER